VYRPLKSRWVGPIINYQRQAVIATPKTLLSYMHLCKGANSWDQVGRESLYYGLVKALGWWTV
jgi:hypothetical protein